MKLLAQISVIESTSRNQKHFQVLANVVRRRMSGLRYQNHHTVFESETIGWVIATWTFGGLKHLEAQTSTRVTSHKIGEKKHDFQFVANKQVVIIRKHLSASDLCISSSGRLVRPGQSGHFQERDETSRSISLIRRRRQLHPRFVEPKNFKGSVQILLALMSDSRDVHTQISGAVDRRMGSPSFPITHTPASKVLVLLGTRAIYHCLYCPLLYKPPAAGQIKESKRLVEVKPRKRA